MRTFIGLPVALCVLALVVALCASQALAQDRPSKIAFSRDGRVMVMNPDGSGAVALVGDGDQDYCYGPCWSPDGLAIAFSSRRNGVEQGADLFMMYADGSNQVQLAGHWQQNDEWAEWSPLGDRIAFTAWALYLLDLPTGAERFAVPDDYGYWDASPTWSQDGESIAFCSSERSGDSTMHIYVVPTNGGPLQDIYPGGPVDWSPAGGWLVYRASIAGAMNILKVPIDDHGTPTGPAVNLTNHGSEKYDDQPTFSPDGQWIAFQRKTSTGKKWGPYHIMRMDANGGNLQDLGLGTNPEWSPWLDTIRPVADARGPSTGTVLTPLDFSGSASYDADGSIQRYVWDFGDGTPRVEGPEVSHTFSRVGTYDVRLIVVDNDRVPNMDFLTVTIERGDNRPIADAGGPYTGFAGYAVTLDGSGSYDPDGDTLWYRWDFGDGSPMSDWSADPIASHIYTAPSLYDVVLWVDDNLNDQAPPVFAASTASITVAPTLNVASIGMSVAKVSAKWQATAVVTIVDGVGVPVSGATVGAAWSGAYSASVSGSTNASGQVTFTSGSVKGSGLTFTLTVTNVTKTGYVFQPGPYDTNSIRTP